MTEPRICDIPSFQKALQDVKTLKALKAARPLLRPVLKLFRADIEKFDEALSRVEELERMAAELTSLPDRFNDLFADRGWISYDLMNVHITKAAVEKAESGDIDGAEADLVNYYTPETVRWLLNTMHGVETFRPRMPLAKRALEDYAAERYHACIPVVLALMDGLVNEVYVKVHGQARGLFAEGTNLEAWDSIAAHSSGLSRLVRVMSKSRQTTRTEQIPLPYRHGILHGLDLGYDNRLVAAKTWASLFTVREWALKAERGQLAEPPQEPVKSWREIFQQMREIADDKERLKAWQPRAIQPGRDIPSTGEPDAFEIGTPERRLCEFLTYWKSRNYGYMAKCLPARTGYPTNGLPARLREQYASKHLRSFEFIEIIDDAPAITEIQTSIVYEEVGNEVRGLVGFRMINEDSEGNPKVRGVPGGKWTVLNWFVI